MDDVLFFPTPTDLREWFMQHHHSAKEVWIGFYKKGSGQPSITWPESVDEALCVGWIDGIRKSIDAYRYKIRFTPRKSRSMWSAVNIRRMSVLIAEGRMQSAGLKVFEQRDERLAGIYAYERANPQLDEAALAQLQANPEAWTFFQKQAPSYQKSASNWVVSAKQEATRQKRLATLINDSASGLKVAPFRRADSSASPAGTPDSSAR